MDATHIIIWIFTFVLLVWIFSYTFGINAPFMGENCDESANHHTPGWTGCPYGNGR